MITRDEILNYLKENQDRFLNEYHIYKIGLFGSYARNEQKHNSDIDLIFEFDENAKHLFATKEAVRELIATQFSTGVDLCREKYIKPYFKESILRDAIFI
ncbi:MAG: nucleotidyltransferase domain-containing protein [Leptospiraceae bacterium]|nr:nucleotidyltransferase domain-containing protein [Leptospiraceae bacterium]